MNSAEGFVRHVAGWREYVRQLHRHFGEDYRNGNTLGHTRELPAYSSELDTDAVTARCLATALTQVRDTGWPHHIPCLMVLGSHASDGTGYAHTSGWLTQADQNHVFRASYDSNFRDVNPYVQSGIWEQPSGRRRPAPEAVAPDAGC